MGFSVSWNYNQNDTWCGEYDFDKEMKALDVGTLSFYEKVNLKIVNPILVKGKSIFGFEKILKIILKNVEEEIGFETQGMEESILNSITIKRELYREKRVNLLNDEIKKVLFRRYRACVTRILWEDAFDFSSVCEICWCWRI